MNLDRPCLIGVVHLPALPGSPGWGGEMDAVIERAVADAVACRDGGMSAVIVENFGDAPFFKDAVPPETIGAMARAGTEVRRAVGPDFPVGFNVLRNDASAALGLCAACGGDFIRVNVHTGAMITDQGIVEGRAAETVRKRDAICPAVKILADVLVKHAAPLGAMDLGQVARDTWERGLADALVVTGKGTGRETAIEDIRTVREAVPEAVCLVGSGVNADRIGRTLEVADGVLVGSWLKRVSGLNRLVELERVRHLVKNSRV